jgi:hypothetical protein
VIFNSIVLALVLTTKAYFIATGIYRRMQVTPVDVVVQVVACVSAFALAVIRFCEPGTFPFVFGLGWVLVTSIGLLVLRDWRRRLREERFDCGCGWGEDCPSREERR